MKHTIILSANTNYRKLVKAQELLDKAETILSEVSQCYCTEMGVDEYFEPESREGDEEYE